MWPLANKIGLKLITKFDRTLPKLNFDRDKIIQVLTNLVDNAAKFTDDGSITITTAKDDNNICVSVQDTGIGIKQEDLSRLFSEFEQLSNIDDRKTGDGIHSQRQVFGAGVRDFSSTGKVGAGVSHFVGDRLEPFAPGRHDFRRGFFESEIQKHEFFHSSLLLCFFSAQKRS